MKSATVGLRPSWQTAIIGAIAAALVAIPLVACRGVGLIEFTIEDIPGTLLGFHSTGLKGLSYLGVGALLALFYRKAFRIFGHTGWNVGMALGLVQWGVLGLLVALLSPLLPNSPVVLPTDSPDSTVYGMFCFLLIFLVQMLFGTLMGISLIVPVEEHQEFRAVEEHPPRAAPKAA